jgi:hypothetical protein
MPKSNVKAYGDSEFKLKNKFYIKQTNP